MADINLIPVEEQAQERFDLLQKRLQVASIGLLVFTVIAAIITLILFATNASKRESLIQQVTDNSTRIDQYKAQEELLVVTKDKATAADTIIASRQQLDSFFGKLALLIPQNVYFTDLKISGNKLTISGRAKTSADVAGLVSSFLSSKGAEILNNVSIDSLGSDETGVYSFVLSSQLIGGGKK